MTASRRSSLCVRLRTACNFSASTTPLGVRRSRWLNSTIVAASLFSACGPGLAQVPAAPVAPATPATTPAPVPPDAGQDHLPRLTSTAADRPRPAEPKPAAPRENPRARTGHLRSRRKQPRAPQVSPSPDPATRLLPRPRPQAHLRLFPLERLPKSPVAWHPRPRSSCIGRHRR